MTYLLIKAAGNNEAVVNSLLAQAQRLYREYVAFENWRLQEII